MTPGTAFSLTGSKPGFMPGRNDITLFRSAVVILNEHIPRMRYIGRESIIPWGPGSFIHFVDRLTGRMYAQERSKCVQER